MRPVELARAVGISQQAVRNYEDARILPPAVRLANGYRSYGPSHLAALHAFAALTVAIGHGAAREIMVACTAGEISRALAALDRAHAQLVTDRETVRRLDRALGDLYPRHRPSAPMSPLTAGELARRLGVTTTALRGWEGAGILSPVRDTSGHRRYDREDVRDAEIAHLLRRAQYPLDRIAAVIRETRNVGDPALAHEAVRARAHEIDRNSRSLLSASAALASYLDRRADEP